MAVEMGALPAVSGTVSVEIAEGMKAEVDAAAYMAELRSEVEGLRAQLTVAKEKQAGAGVGMIQYVQSLPTEEAQGLVNNRRTNWRFAFNGVLGEEAKMKRSPKRWASATCRQASQVAAHRATHRGHPIMQVPAACTTFGALPHCVWKGEGREIGRAHV